MGSGGNPGSPGEDRRVRVYEGLDETISLLNRITFSDSSTAQSDPDQQYAPSSVYPSSSISSCRSLRESYPTSRPTNRGINFTADQEEAIFRFRVFDAMTWPQIVEDKNPQMGPFGSQEIGRAHV